MTQLTWLITGCSSGFGFECAKALLARDDHVIATARNASQRLQVLKEAGAAIFDLDVCDSQAELDAKVMNALGLYGTIDVLFNNAGYSEIGLCEEVPSKRFLAQLQTNLIGSISVTRAVLPHFSAKRSGTIVFNGSMWGHIGPALCSPYSISKFALEGFAESLNAEVGPLGIRVLIVEPGAFCTEIINKHKRSDCGNKDYAELYNGFLTLADTLNGNQPGDPRKAVERIIDVVKGEGMAKGKEFPLRLPLGQDALSLIREKCQGTLKICDEWEDMIKSTNFD